MTPAREESPEARPLKLSLQYLPPLACIQSASFTECLMRARALCQAENIDMNKTWSLTPRVGDQYGNESSVRYEEHRLQGG